MVARVRLVRAFSIAIVSGLIGFFIASPAAASPPNDLFAAATVLSGTRVTVTGSNVGATSEGGEPVHAGQPGGASVWYSWTPSVGGPTVITTAGSAIDTLLGVYVGTSVAALTTVASNDDDPNANVLTSRVVFNAVGATTYHIAVDGYGGETGPIRLRLFEGPPSTIRASVTSGGGEANGVSWVSVTSNVNGGEDSGTTAVSDGGTAVAFASSASNLVSGDTFGNDDIFVRNPLAGTTTRVSVSDSETQANDNSFDPSMSADGNRVAFTSQATNLTGSDNNGSVGDIFVRDILAGTTTMASVATGGTQANDWSQNPAISADGDHVVFESWADNLGGTDTLGNLDIFERNITAATTTRITVDNAGGETNNDSFDPAVSSDGRYVAFESRATDLLAPGTDTNGVRDIFVRDTLMNTTTRVSVATGGAEGNGVSLNPSISADGRYVAFESSADNFVATDTNGVRDVFVHDMLTGATTRVSVRSGGIQAKADSHDPQISADGRYVVFSSDAPNLVPGDQNGSTDVFLHDMLTGITSRLSVATGGAEGNDVSMFPSISGDHTSAVFQSDADNLVSGDNAGNTDVFQRPIGYQVDGLVKSKLDTAFLGDGVYNTTGASQTKLLKVKHGSKNSFNLSFQDDGSVSDQATIHGCGNSPGFKVTYMAGTTNVTPQVVAGTYQTPVLTPDDSFDQLVATIAVSKTAKTGALKACPVTATSLSDATKADTVQAQVKVLAT